MSRLNVCYASDDNYSVYMGVSILSLLYNNRNFSEIVVYVLDDGISTVNKKSIESMVKSYGDGRSVKFIDVSRAVNHIKELGVNSWNGGFTAYSRIFIDAFIDSEKAERVIYLDCDTVVNDSLDGLYNIDLKGKAFAGVHDYWAGKNYRRIIGLSKKDPYCNSGVMLIDMKKWRELKCRKRMLCHVKNKRAKYLFPDQDIINIVLKGQYSIASLKYNFCPEFLLFSPAQIRLMHGRTKNDYYSDAVIESAKKNPIIVHYVGVVALKPWFSGYESPLTYLWDYYLSLSPWRGLKRKKYTLPFHKKISIGIKNLLPIWVYCVVYRYMAEATKLHMSIKVQKNDLSRRKK